MTNDSAFSDIPWVIESKFEPNRPRLELVRRDRLLSQLTEGEPKKVALIIAPAGYGKSSLLGQWVAYAEQNNKNFGWLTLESGEADTKQFLAYIVLVLARSGMVLDELITGARDGFSDAAVENVLSKLIRLLNESEQQMVLILEDYHSAECDAVNSIVKRLIRDTLEKFTIFIDSRKQPNIDAFSLIASGDAVEINAAQLRLTKEETLLALGEVTDERSALSIYQQTEGWPVAVQLALVQKRTQPSEPIIAGVDGGLVASYLTEQILSTLSIEVQDFLLAVSFLERFNPELTNFVLENANAWRQVDSLSSFAAVIVPLDMKGGWYRLHHLFAEYLREMQIRRDPSIANRTLSRASQWYDEKKQIVEAVRYASKAEDFEECERLILAAGGWKIILNEGVSVLRNALRLLPGDIIDSSSRLMISQAYLHCKHGEIRDARELLDASVQATDAQTPVLYDTDRLIVETMVNLYEDRVDGWTPEYRRTRKLYADHDAIDALGKGTMLCEDVLIHLSRAEFTDAGECLRNAFAMMRQSGSVLGLNYCYIHAAQIALFRGDIATAAANIERAGKMADENFGSDSGLKAIATVLGHALGVYQGKSNIEELPEITKTLWHTIDNDGWVEIYLAGMQSVLMLTDQCGDTRHANELIDGLIKFSEKRNLNRLSLYAEIRKSGHRNPPQDKLSTAPGGGVDLLKFATAYSWEDQPRDWQSFLLASCMIAVSAPIDVSRPILERAFALVEEKQAGLWALRLRIANIVAVLNAEGEQSAKILLLELLRVAQPLQSMGVFLCEDSIIRLLGQLRSDLRQNEDELIILQFIDEILAREKVLKPNREKGILSDREFEILHKLADGLSNKEIARELELTENTVKFHLKSLYSKLSVGKRLQAVAEARRIGLVD